MTARKSGTRRSPQCTKNPPRRHLLGAGAQTVRTQSMASPAKLEEIQEQHSAAIDNEDMLNVVTRRYHQTLFALAVMHA